MFSSEYNLVNQYRP